jgi:antitoxin MazE
LTDHRDWNNIVTTMKPLHITIRQIGNSHGVVIPKPLLAQAGLVGEAEMTVEHGAIVLRKPTESARRGWADAARAVAAHGGDELLMGEFGNEGDSELVW